MRSTLHTASLALFAGCLSLSHLACSAGGGQHDGDRAGDGRGDQETQTGETSAPIETVRGRIVAAPADALVEVYQVADDGQLMPLSDCACAPDDGGNYEVPLSTLPDLAAGPLIVQVSAGAEVVGSVIVSLDGSVDGVIAAAPIDLESTVEVDAFASTGFSLDGSELSTLAVFVDAKLAAAVAASADYKAQVALVAEGALAAAIAFESAIETQLGGDAELVLDTAEQILVEAQAELQASLAAAESDAEIEAALSAYAELFVEAYLASGCTAEEVAAAAHATVEALLHFTAELTVEAQAAAQAHAHAVLAIAIDACLDAQLALLGVSSTSLELIAQAHATLMVEIAAAANLGAQAQAHIEAAFAAYAELCGDVVESSVALGLSTVTQLKTTLASLEASLEATLEATKGAAGEVGVSVGNACTDYFVDAKAAVEGGLLVNVVGSEAEVAALATVVAELSLIDG